MIPRGPLHAIHPYEDGNGRLARALTDRTIARDDRQSLRYYSMSSQIMKERAAHYAAIGRCSTGDGDLTAWLVWFLGCFGGAIEGSESHESLMRMDTWGWSSPRAARSILS